MIPITIALIVVQEMCARMGVVTGKGLSDLIREEFGLRITFVVMLLLVVVNYTNVVTEFIGIAGSLHLFHVSKFISVPICAFLVWALILRGDYKSTEKIFLAASAVYIAYIFAGVLAQPDWHESLRATVTLPAKSVWRDKAYIYMAVGVVGTTIAPWMQFYLQSSIVEKGIGVKDYSASRLDVIVGCFFTDMIAWFIVVACAATLFVHGMGAIQVAADAAEVHAPVCRRLRLLSFSPSGLFNASLFRRLYPAALHGLHRLRRWAGRGIRRRQDLSARRRSSHWLYSLLIVGGALTVFAAARSRNSINVAILSQVLNGVLLPVVIILMLHPDQPHRPHCSAYKNSRLWNVDCVGDERHRHCDDIRDALGPDDGTLMQRVSESAFNAGRKPPLPILFALFAENGWESNECGHPSRNHLQLRAHSAIATPQQNHRHTENHDPD